MPTTSGEDFTTTLAARCWSIPYPTLAVREVPYASAHDTSQARLTQVTL
jgi:hypothetical protein